MGYDLKISGAVVVDGTGGDAFEGDIGIVDGRIVAVGDAPDDAIRVLDAEGRVVSPGFIDIHTHLDAQALFEPMLTPSSWHGVTTVVAGNCGFGIAPMPREFQDLMLRSLENVEGMHYESLLEGLGADWGFETFSEYLAAIEGRGIAINFAAYVGHTPLRLAVMGKEATERAATPDEILEMRRLVKDALDAGAVGFSTSKSPSHIVWDGRPAPSRLAEWDEIAGIASALADANKGVFMATIGPDFLVPELGEVHRLTGRPVTFGGVLTDMGGIGKHRRLVERLDAARAEGADVVAQMTHRPLMFDFGMENPYVLTQGSIAVLRLESLEALFAPVLAETTTQGKSAHYGDAAFRAEFRRLTDSERWHSALWANMVISEVPGRPELENRRIVDVSTERGLHPSEVLLDISVASDLQARFGMAILNTDTAEIDRLLLNPGMQLALSDAGAHINEICDAVFATDFLAKCVRERQVLTLEDGVAMLTSRPAALFGFADRGRLAPGCAADLVVFDPATVGAGPPRRVWDLPAGAPRLVADAVGVKAVVVNGVVIREEGSDTVAPDGDLPGRIVRN